MIPAFLTFRTEMFRLEETDLAWMGHGVQGAPLQPRAGFVPFSFLPVCFIDGKTSFVVFTD